MRKSWMLFGTMTALGLGSFACGGAEEGELVERRTPGEEGAGGGGSAGEGAGAGAGADGAEWVGPIPVADTPVASPPSVPTQGSYSGPEASAGEYSRDWWVSPSGDDSADGSEGAPFRTLAQAVSVAGPGERIRVLAGTYEERLNIDGGAAYGESGSPIVIQGEGSPRIVGDGSGPLVTVRRPGWIIDGFDIDVQGDMQFGVSFAEDVEGSTLMNSAVHGGTHGAGINLHDGASGVIIENNHIYDFRKSGEDSHGVIVQTTTRNTTIRNNAIHDNSGDSIQCLGPDGYNSNAPADGVVIERNHLYESDENGVDIKTCQNVTIGGNVMHGFRVAPANQGSKGDAVVVHYSASNVTIEDNKLFDIGKGVALGGNHSGTVPSGVVIRRNRIWDVKALDGAEGVGIRVENSDGTQVLHNTISGTDGPALVIGHGSGGDAQSPFVKNNLIDAAVALDLGASAPGADIDSNLYVTGVRFTVAGGGDLDLAGWKSQGFDASSDEGSISLDDALVPGSEAVDKGVDVGLGHCGAAPDLGAVETDC